MPSKIIWQIVRFGCVGVVATLTHILTLIILVELAGWPAWVSNGAAFICAVGVTYIGQSYFVFQDKQHTFDKFTRFISVAILGLTLNVSIMYATTHILYLDYILGLILSILLVPTLTFVLNKIWVFGPHR